MSATIAVACPECDKQLKIRADLEGKKVRCKDCGHVFAVKSPAIQKAPPPKKAEPPPKPKPGRQVEDEEEYGDQNPYGITSVELGHRCPHCAADLEAEDSIVCINCGYNLATREHLRTTKTIENTGGDQFMWLLPGIACVLAIFAMIGLDVFWCFFLFGMVEESDLEFLASGPITLWVVISTLFGMFYAGKFAFNRLLVDPVAPEKEKV